MKKYNIEKIDFMIIDVEGYEWNIIKNYNLNYIKPKIIIYEKTHLSRQDQIDSMEYLARFGYTIQAVDDNIVAEQIHIQ